MKKILFIILLICTSLTIADAKINFGIRGGYNISNITGGISAENKAGFYIGPTIKLSVPITGLSFDASALYDSRTATINEQSITSKQITIPINVRYGIGLGSAASIFAFAGPQFGFNVGGDKKLYEEVADWTWKTSNFSVNVGIGASFLKHLEVKVNYSIACGRTGEVKVIDTTKSTAENIAQLNGKYNAWQLGLAYYF